MTDAKPSTPVAILELKDELAVARSLAHAIELAAGGMLSQEDGGAIEAVCGALLVKLDRIDARVEEIGRGDPPTMVRAH